MTLRPVTVLGPFYVFPLITLTKPHGGEGAIIPSLQRKKLRFWEDSCSQREEVSTYLRGDGELREHHDPRT